MASNLTMLEKAERLQTVAHLHFKGLTHAAIAEKVGVSRSIITRDIKTLAELWLADAKVDRERWLAGELAKINHLEATYWQAWEESCGMRETKTTEESRRDTPAAPQPLGRNLAPQQAKVIRAQVRTETMLGNPAYLAGVQWCIERRSKMLGLDAATDLNLNIVKAYIGINIDEV